MIGWLRNIWSRRPHYIFVHRQAYWHSRYFMFRFDRYGWRIEIVLWFFRIEVGE